MRLVTAAALLFCAGACSSGAVCDAGTELVSGTGGGSGEPVLPIGAPGQPMSLQLFVPLALDACTGRPITPTQVETSVLDPMNHRVPAAATAPHAVNASAITAVTFTPQLPGRYQVTVRFDPGIGTTQQDVLVAGDRSTEVPAVVSLPAAPDAVSCAEIDFDSDTLLCLDAADGGSWLRTIRGAAIVDRVNASTFALDEGRVWALSPADGQLHLYALGADGALTEVSSTFLAANGRMQVLAHRDTALIAGNGGFYELHFDADAGWSQSNLATISDSGGAGGVQWVPDVGVTVVSSWEVWSYAVDAGQYSSVSSSLGSLTAKPIGFDDDGLWWVNADSLSRRLTFFVNRWKVGAAAPLAATLEGLDLDPPMSSAGQWVPQVSPLLYGGDVGNPATPTVVFVPSFDGQTISLVRYPMSANLHADSRRVWFQEGDTIKWYAR